MSESNEKATAAPKSWLKWVAVAVAALALIGFLGFRYWTARQNALPDGIASGNGRLEARSTWPRGAAGLRSLSTRARLFTPSGARADGHVDAGGRAGGSRGQGRRRRSASRKPRLRSALVLSEQLPRPDKAPNSAQRAYRHQRRWTSVAPRWERPRPRSTKPRRRWQPGVRGGGASRGDDSTRSTTPR